MQKLSRVILAITLWMTVWMSVQTVAAAASFTDTKTHWAKVEIDSAVTQGWINGYDASTFRPNANMTRAEFLKSLVGAMKLKAEDIDTPFVDDKGWFRGYIATGLKQSIIKVADYKENTFEPNRMITREEIARMTIRALGKDAEGEKNGHLAVAKKLEIMKGYPDGTMGGEKNATRAEAVVMVLNTLKVKNPPAAVVVYPKTKEQIDVLVKSLSSFKGTTMYGDDILLINSKGSEEFSDNTLYLEYSKTLKVTKITVVDPISANLEILKDLLRNYYPKSYEKAYSIFLKVNESNGTGTDSDIKTKYDNRTFEVFKGSGKRITIWIGE